MHSSTKAMLGYDSRHLLWREWTVLALVLAVVLISPWFTALFFVPASTIAVAIVALITLIASGAYYRDLDLRSVSFWVVAFSGYTMLTNLWSANLSLSLQSTLLQTAGLLLFVIVLRYSGMIIRWVVPGLAVLGIALYVYGMGAGVNWWKATDAVYDAHELASVFQYHNTFGSLEVAIGIIGYLAGMTYHKWYYNSLGALAMIVGLDAMLGSGSREVWVLAPIFIILAIVVSARIQKTVRPVATGLLLVIVGVISGLFTLKALSHTDAKSFIEAMVIAAAGAVLTAWIDHILVNLRMSQKTVYIGIGVVVLAGIAGGYKFRSHFLGTSGSVAAKLHSISLANVSLQERFQYYKDAIPMWLHSPIFGSGGGTWGAEFQAYQSLPYWSEQVHSLFFDQLLNGGIIGLALFLGVVIWSVIQSIRFIRNSQSKQAQLIRAGMLIAVLGVFTHALFDFDFAFGYITLLFWIMLALSAGQYADASSAQVAATIAPHNAQAKNLRSRDKQQEQVVAVRQRIALVSMYVLAAIDLGYSATLASAQVLGQESNSVQSLATRYSMAQTAASLAPYDANTELSLANYYMQTAQSSQDTSLYAQALQAADTAAAYGHYDPKIQSKAAVLLYSLGNQQQALVLAKQAVQDGPFTSDPMRNLMGLQMWTSAALLKTNHAAGIAGLQQVLSDYQSYKEREPIINQKLFPASTPLTEDASMQVYLATSDYLLGHYAQSIKDMTPFLKTNRDQAAVTLYLIDSVLSDAAMHKTSISDKMYMSQIQSNPQALSEYKYLKSL